MNIRACLPLLFGAALLSFSAANADQVHLKDGTVLMGTLKGVADGKLQLEASFGGAVSLPWEQVVTLQLEHPVDILLLDGARLKGTPMLRNGAQYLQRADGGTSSLSLGSVNAIVIAGTPPDEGAGEPDDALKSQSDANKQEEIWSGRAELGLNGQTGNKERFDVRAGIDLNRKVELWRLNLYLKGQYAETNSERSANEIMGGTRAEFNLSERTYVFGKLDLEHDEFEDLEVRTTATTGLGHYFVKQEKLELKGWLGAGYEHERFKKDPEAVPTDLPTPTTLEESVRQILLLTRSRNSTITTTNEAVAEAGYSYQQDFQKNFKFKHGITYYPSVDSPFSQYRIAADTAMEFPVGTAKDWTIRTGVRNEYDAAPQDGVDKLDTTYYLNLGYNW